MSFTRTSCISVLLLLLLAIACEARVPRSENNAGFITVKDAHFELNGSPFLFNGFNSYWLMHVAAVPNERHKVTDVLKGASTAGLSVCRTWAFSDGGYGALQISPGIYNERVFQNEFGGKAQYVQWARNAKAYINSDDDFYTHPMLKTYYKNHIEKIVTRFNTITKVAYKDDPTIMAWELMNEPRDQADIRKNC
ncbi:mannan endo-1,4-beta-mannosidase 1-like [Lycium barbarum]|uniref:mannan endo-1,4-beta-mannosidase 1-like n=1 Tax=Lycium barbarum TaxID=112863 RepID=UPI00293EF02D|nr:mannan endo-1,4-beta-mannosidase 1-like [Lycium barbarum]